MRQGYIPVAICAPELILGDPAANGETHAKMIGAAIHHGTKIAVFPELSLTGASLGGLFLHSKLMDSVEKAIVDVVNSTKDSDIIAVFGAPVRANGRLYDCAIVAGNGHIHGIVPKTNVEGMGHEKIFAPAPGTNGKCIVAGMEVPFGTDIIFQSLLIPELRVAVELGGDSRSVIPPAAHHALAGATVIVSPTATESTAGTAGAEGARLREQSERYACAYIRSDAGTDESVSGGMCLSYGAVLENGEAIKETIHNKDTILEAEVDVQLLQSVRERRREFRRETPSGYDTVYFNNAPLVTKLTRTVKTAPYVWGQPGRDGWCDTLMQMQADAIKRRLEGVGAEAVVILLDGGMASAIGAYNAVRAVMAMGKPSENVFCLTCRGPGQTPPASNRAIALADALKTSTAVLDITEQYNSRLALLGLDENVDPEGALDIARRLRRSITMDLAEQVGGIVLNTDDMSDWALGRVATPADPDTFAVNAGIPKTVLRHMLLRLLEQEDDFRQLSNVLRAISVEDGGKCNPGRNQQNKETEQTVFTDLMVNDFCLYHVVKYGFSPNKVLRLADSAFGSQLGDVTLYKYVSDFFRTFMANRVLHSAVPDGPRYFEEDLRLAVLNGDFYEDLWEGELQGMKPDGVDIDAAAAEQVAQRDGEVEAKRRAQREERMKAEEEMMRQMSEARKTAEEQIARERAQEAQMASPVGRRMKEFDTVPDDLKAQLEAKLASEKAQTEQEDPMARFERMRRLAEAQIAQERAEEKKDK